LVIKQRTLSVRGR